MMDAILWVGGHSNKMASALRAFMYMSIALEWAHLTEAQIGAILLFTEAFLGLFVESNTVSKVKVAQIEEKAETKAEAKMEAKVEERVAQITNATGHV